MQPRKTVLTTGEVARICSVAPRTVSKWFDAGHLRGYRIPGSKDRRIPIEHLIRFMRAHGIPLNGLESGAVRVLVLDGDASLSEALRRALTATGRYEVVTAGSALEAGAAYNELKPNVVVVDVTLPDVDPRAMTRFVHSFDNPEPTCLFGIAPNLSDAQGHALLQAGFDGYLSKPFDTRSLILLIEQKVSPALPNRSA